jgi:hypothetical protein
MKRTLAILVCVSLSFLGLGSLDSAENKVPPSKEDPAASKLLADAVAARAAWMNFPGFTADLEVNFDGKTAKGKVMVSEKGRVELELDGKEVDAARVATAKDALASLVGHRMPSAGGRQTPCSFGEEASENPQGKLILVVDDKHHSSYRIRDQQILSVTRQMGDTRFTITMLENRLNEEKRVLPVSYVVNYWDTKTNALDHTTAHHQTWKRVGAYDLPQTMDELTAGSGKLESYCLKLSNHKLSQ